MTYKELDHKTVLSILPDRESAANKGDFGKILLLCGSVGYTGAAALATMGALRAGAGLVYLGVPESIYAIEATKLLEPVVFPLPDRQGMLCEDSIKGIERLLPKMNAVLIGPGLGRSDETFNVVQYVLKKYQGPIILDADGINVLTDHKNVLRGRTAQTILTPHEGEFLRLMHMDAIEDRTAAAVQLALEWNVITVLKGSHTVITDGHTVFVNPTGNPGMAVGGSGDVLAGMITSLVGQGIPGIEAAACAVWLHGAAGDLCAEELGQYCMLPSDILWALPRLMK